MAIRTLYLGRHGMADPFGALTPTGRAQAGLLGERLTAVPVDAVWHSPLPRAADSAHELAQHLPNAPVAQAAELVDHVPHVPTGEGVPWSWAAFFDRYDEAEAEAEAGRRLADALIARFAKPADATRLHEVLITHAYPIAWLLRHALGAPPQAWLGLTAAANAGLTVIEYADDAPPRVVMVNDQSHLPPDLRWTGVSAGVWP